MEPQLRSGLLLGASAWNFRLRRFSYLCTCWPICCHFLRRRISESRSYFFMTRRMVLGLRWMPCFSSASHIRPVAVGTEAALMLFRNEFRQRRVLLRPPQTMDEVIVAASGYLKESAHDGYRIFVPVPVDNCVFCPWPHFLPVERRKSRSSLFSIFSRCIS